MAYYRTMDGGINQKIEPLRIPGEVISSRYTVVKAIGKGATGEVYIVADQEQNDELMALKYMKLDPEMTVALDHFKSEFDTMTHLNHPNIAKVYDFEWDDQLKFFFFTSELIDGTDFVTSTKEMDIEGIETLLIQSLRALEYLHGHNVFHYDIKPQNILIQDAFGPSPSAKVIDFGLASATPPDKLVGTPSYIAPEIISKKKPDGRADLYSLGVLAYFALTGINPFRGATTEQTLQNHFDVKPVAPSDMNPAVPKYLSSIVMKLLEIDPEHRFATPADVIRDINFRSNRFYAIETPTTLMSYIPWEGPFVGRKDILATYKDWLGAAEESDNSSIFWICGGLGSGKSRLLEECKNIAQLDNFGTILATGIGHKFLQKLEHAKMSSLIIVDDLEKVIELTAAENIPEFQKYLHKLCSVITTADDEATQERVRRFLNDAGISEIRKVDLDNFSLRELQDYIKTLTGLNQPPNWLISSLYKFTEGNPFFITETFKQMISSGLLFDQSGRWKKATMEDLGIEISQLEIPESVSKKLRNLVDSLNEKQKQILAVLSACRLPAGAAVLKEFFDSDYETALEELTNNSITTHNAVNSEYAFKSTIIKLAVYNNLPAKQRRAIHDRLAGYLLSHGAGEAVAAYHVQRGSDDNAARAALLKCIHDESNKNETISAINVFLNRFGDTLDEDVFQATILKAEKLVEQRKHREAGEIYTQLFRKLPVPAHAPKWHFEYHIALGSLLRRERKYEDAILEIKEAKKFLDKIDNPAASIIADNHLAFIDLLMGNFDYAIEKYTATRNMAKKLSSEDREKISNNNLGQALFYKGKYEEAEDVLKDDVKHFRKINNKWQLCHALYMLGETYRRLRKFEKAEDIFNEIIPVAKEIGYTGSLYRAYIGIGNVLSGRSNYADSIGYMDRALDLAIHLGDFDAAAMIMINNGILYSHINESKKSFDTFETAVTFLNRKDFPVTTRDLYLCKAHLELGELYRIEKKYSKSGQHLAMALELAKAPEARYNLFWILLTEAKLSKDMNEKDKTKRFMKEAKKLADSADKKKLLGEVKEYVS